MPICRCDYEEIELGGLFFFSGEGDLNPDCWDDSLAR